MPQRRIETTLSVDVPGQEPIRARDVIRHALATDQRFNSDYEGMKRAARIDDACNGKSPQPVLIDEGDWEKLCEALRAPAPTRGFPAYALSPAHRMLALTATILDADPVDATAATRPRK